MRPFALLLAGICAACTGGAPAPGQPPPPPVSGPEVATATAATPPPVAACQGGVGAPVFHRLNRTEYQNTVNQLLGIELPLRERLPPDTSLYGFDNNADTAVSAPLLQRYLDAGAAAVAAALARPDSRDRLVPCRPEADPGCARRVLEAFLPRAFRRPVQPAEVDEHLRHAALCADGPAGGLGCALEAALVSPEFLFRVELPGSPVACTQPSVGVPLDPFALASRLSFFLWSSGPDQRLLDLAASGRLTDPDVIEGEVNRMLAPAAQARFTRALVAGFPGQWLGLEGLAGATPSPAAHPTFDEELRRAMTAESELFFAEILQQNRPALELVEARFTFANQRLAAHYGLGGVEGAALRRVETAARPRGGVLTQGSFLTLTSSPETPSVPARGRWVLQNLLCTPLDDPPPGALEMVPPPDPSLGLSRRESLVRRTAAAACNACHAALNPIGFGLDIFDAVGVERATEGGRPIDASGVLPSGEAFADTRQLLALLARDERFPACLTRKLLTYALGRGLQGPCDEATVKALSDELVKDGHRLKNHIVRIARSELFRTARRRP